MDQQVGSGRYSSVSDYVRDLIRNDEKRKTQEQLEAVLLEGVRSSEASEITREDWTSIRRDALKQFDAGKARTRS